MSLGLLSFTALTLQAAEPQTLESQPSVPNSFVEKLMSPATEGQGTVTIRQDPRLSVKMGDPGHTTPANIVIINERPYLKMTGYRIQAFSSNNQATAKQEAFRKEAALKAAEPDLTTYVRYSAPFWRVRVGDFLTYEEAYEVLLRFKKTFVYGREMSIVRETINVPISL